ncbi:MAG: hypothetical protein AVDCRST_MAG12-2050, partial [uncultured Rubrobacteraceae bacterium]
GGARGHLRRGGHRRELGGALPHARALPPRRGRGCRGPRLRLPARPGPARHRVRARHKSSGPRDGRTL